MKKSIILLAVLSAFAMNANATNFGDTNNTTNNNQSYHNPTATANGGNSSAVGNGGAGGAGGSSNATGGSAVVNGSGNSSNDIRNTSTNLNTQTSTNLNTNTNTNLNTNGQQQGQGQLQGQGQGQKQSTENANNSAQSVHVEGDDAARIPVASAIAMAPAPSATCRTGGAVGIQVMGFGGSIGGDTAVNTCEINEAARIAYAIGDKTGAQEIMCQNKWAAVTTACKAIAKADAAEKQAAIQAKTPIVATKAAPATEAKAQVTVEPLVEQVTYSDNGYYSVTTNPLAR